MKSTHNNIDKLFADKLSALESSPSAEAWMALEKGLVQTQKKKKGIWFTYAAAAAVALMIVSFLWLREQSEITPIASATSALAEKNNQSGKQSEIISSPNKVTEKNTEIESLLKNQPDELITQITGKQSKTLSEIKSGETKKKTVQTLPVIEKQPEIKTIVPQLPAEELIATLDVQQEVIAAPAISNTIIVKVELEETKEAEFSEVEITEEPEKQSKGGKLLDKLMKLKKGEFNQLGVKPEILVAFVKEKANNAFSNNNDDK
jgi:hypothetical protein